MKRIAFLFVILIFTMTMWAQTAKKPTIMILPSDTWCTQRYFMSKYQNQGMTVSTPDYQSAFREDVELKAVVSKLREMLIELGYDNIKDCEMELKNIALRQTEDNNTFSRTSGVEIAETPLDQLKRRTKSDIVIFVDWTVTEENRGRAIGFTLEAVDAYTSKNIASVYGVGKKSNESIPRMLEEAVKGKVVQFDGQIMKHYESIKKNGREIILTVRCWSNWENNLETEYSGEELLDCIQNWLTQNTVAGAYNLTDADEVFAQFEQVRIPVFDNNGKAEDARSFAVKLRKYLNASPYGIDVKVMQRGLGEAILVLGEK